MPSECGHFHNELLPVLLDEESLRLTLDNFRIYVSDAVALLRQSTASLPPQDDSHDSIYTGNTGIALMLLRIAAQDDVLKLDDVLFNDLPSLVEHYLPVLETHSPRFGHLSPLDTSSGPALIYVLSKLAIRTPTSSSASSRKSVSDRSDEDSDWDIALSTLRRAVRVALEDKRQGGDEVLYGRAGLLWGLINLNSWMEVHGENSERKRKIAHDLEKIAAIGVVAQLVNEIMETGIAGAATYKETFGEVGGGISLMWQWRGKWYLGAIHGVAGILTVLLQAPRRVVLPHLERITDCVSELLALTSQYGGHLPSSLPARVRTYPHVQICHGSPGLLLLMATMRSRFPDEWQPEWDRLEAQASDQVWRGGLLKKGIGICHGISGNAYPMLLRAAHQESTPAGDLSLARALAILEHARELPPLSRGLSTSYRTPDNPYSLFEGIAGTICAWADACAVIQERLAMKEKSQSERSLRSSGGTVVFGFPGLGGIRPHGIL